MNRPLEEAAEPSREQLEEQAEDARARLASDIDELKRRGQRVVASVSAVRTTVKRHPGIALGVAAGAVVVLGLVWRARGRRRQHEMRRELVLGVIGRVLGPGYAPKPPAPRSSPIKNAIAQAGKELAVSAGREIGRRALLAVAGSIEPSVEAADGPA